MSNGVKVAAAVGAGYFLGRTKKMRLALMLAAAGVTGKFPARPSDLVIQGVKSLGSTDQVHELTDQLRSGLLGAAQAAAVAAATSQVDALNNRLQGVDLGADEAAGTVSEAAQRTARGTTKPLRGRKGSSARAAETDDDNYDDEDLDAIEDEDDDTEDTGVIDEKGIDDEPEPPVRRRRSTRHTAPAKTAGRRSSQAAAHDEPRVRAARRRSSASVSDSPVRRRR